MLPCTPLLSTCTQWRHHKNEGLDVIRTLSEHQPHAEIIAISGDLSRDLMEKLLRPAPPALPKPLAEEVTLLSISLRLIFNCVSKRRPLHHSLEVPITPINCAAHCRTQSERNPILLDANPVVERRCRQHSQPTGTDEPFVSINISSIAENLSNRTL